MQKQQSQPCNAEAAGAILICRNCRRYIVMQNSRRYNVMQKQQVLLTNEVIAGATL
jgi:hypothetical protein